MFRTAMLAPAILITATAATGHTEAPPIPRPGWSLELVAAAPSIKYPSAVEVAPDGRVFVAEDPMDIVLPADRAGGRILCLHPGGRISVWAEGLHAVFGLHYLDGKLYVLHNPKLTVFVDQGDRGGKPKDLIASTNPNPWQGDWNDHVPANFRLAMDGYFYMAVGDKGIYGAVGRDGRRVDLAGGGILRLRPDGTGLEVYATGVRNIMDVALSAEDEIFTYDNTDEKDWMTRLTHMVDGGFYGYPYDFVSRRPYSLWMMLDYGGGAPTGTIAYEEDALPQELRGNLLLADFGKRQILRVPVVRDGGTFRALFREDLFPNPPSDFRPVGIALAPDGKSLYVCDWNHSDVKVKDRVEVGRLFKLTWTGPTHTTPKPSWFLAAALGKPIAAPTAELVAALAHPARSVRLVAQRRLAERGAVARTALTTLLGDRAAPPHARGHAIWALDALDRASKSHLSRPAILAAASGADASVRRQAIRQLGASGAREAIPVLRQRLRDADASVRFHAATALGRLGAAAKVAAPALVEALGDGDLFARFAAFTALGRIGRQHPGAWSIVAGALEHANPRVREAAGFAARETFDQRLVAALIDRIRGSRDGDARARAVRVLAGLGRQRPPWAGHYWGTHPASSPPPERTAEWAGTGAVDAALGAALGDADVRVRGAAVDGARTANARGIRQQLRALLGRERDPQIRQSAVEALGELGDQSDGRLLVDTFKQASELEPVRAAAITAAERVGGDLCSSELVAFVKQPAGAGPALVEQAIGAIGNLKLAAGVDAVGAHTRDREEAVRRAALTALGKIGGPSTAALLVAMRADRSPGIRRAVVAALGALRDPSVIPELLAAARDPETRVEAALALAQVPDLRAVDVYLDGLGAPNAELRAACGRAIGRLRGGALPTIEARVGSLRPQVIATLQELFDRDARARKGPLFAANAVHYEAADYLEHALKAAGNATHGRRLFADPAGVGCIKCHRVRGEGGEVGPDLSTIGVQFARQMMAENVLFPSRGVREGYQQVGIELDDGTVFSGIVRGETDRFVTMIDSDAKPQQVPKAHIKQRAASAVSLMPEGLEKGLSLQDFADLVSYLESLR